MAPVSSDELSDIVDALAVAVWAVYLEEGQLIVDQTHERSVAFHIGRRLAASLVGTGLDVDLEYNRLHRAGRPGPSRDPKRLGPQRNGRLVVPDLIVHRRGTDDNVVAVECKHSLSSPKKVLADLEKLYGYRRDLRYQAAIFLLLDPDGPRWIEPTPGLQLSDLEVLDLIPRPS